MSDFGVTHVAPPEGLQAWQVPDPSVPPVAQVQAGVHMQLLERRGAWAHVRFSNGWSGWVDGRRIVDAQPVERPVPAPVERPSPAPVERPAEPAQVERPAEPSQRPAKPPAQEPAPTVAAPGAQPDSLDDPFSGLEPGLRPEPAPRPKLAEPTRTTPRPVEQSGPRPSDEGDGGRRLPFDPASLRPIPALLGAAAVLLGTFFAWITIDDADGNAYDVPREFLWNHQSASGGGLKVGLILLALAGAVGALCFLPGKVKPRRIIGGVVIAITLIYVVQLQRALSDAGDAAPGLLSALGFGVLLTLLGAAAIVYDREDTALQN